MSKSNRIGAAQLFLFMLISRVVVTLTYSINSGDHTVNHADWLAALLLPAVLAVLAVPVFWLLRVSGGADICTYAYTLDKPAGIAVSVAYAFLFFVMAVATIARFSFFVTSTMQPERGAFFFPVLIALPVFYAAAKGLQAIMRTGALLTVASLLIIVGIMVTLIPRFDGLNVYTPLYDGWGNVGQSLLLLISNSMGHVVLLFLAPRVRGGIKGAYAAFALAAPIMIFLILFTTLAVLGPYSTLQLFPFYSAAGIAKLGELSNLSALEAGVWICGVFLRASLFMVLCWQCLSRILPARFRVWTLAALTAGVALCAALGSSTVQASHQNFTVAGPLAAVGVFTVLVPCVLALAGLMRNKRRKSRGATH